MSKINIEKQCMYCKHAMHFGFHGVKIQCDVDNKEMFGYNGKNEYRENAKDCVNFTPNGSGAWNFHIAYRKKFPFIKIGFNSIKDLYIER